MHLDEVKMTYWQHMKFAMDNAAKLFEASIALAIHAIYPEWLISHGSSIVNQVHYDLMFKRENKNKILIKFNTKWQEDWLGRKWRILNQDVEYLAQDVCVTIPCTTIYQEAKDGTRWHLLCYGDIVWNKNKVVIK